MTEEIYYTARITNAASDVGGQRLRVAVHAHIDGHPTGREIASYAVETIMGSVDEADEGDAARTLADHGWEHISAGWDFLPEEDASYADVKPTDWRQIVEDATNFRDETWERAKTAETAWQFVIKQAQPADVLGATATAKAARISRERVYQIRDDRR